MKNKTRTFFTFIIGWPLSLLALFFIGKLLLSKQTIFTHIHTLNLPLLLLGIFCFLVFFFLRVLFWQKLLVSKNIHFSYKHTAVTWGLSEFKRYIPGGIWPILGRTHAYKNEEKAILINLVQEAVFVSISCILLSLLCLNFLLFTLLPEPYNIFTAALLTTTAFFATSILIFHEKLFTKKPKLLMHFFPSIPTHAIAKLFLLMTGAFFLFGLGTYFSITAIVPLYLPHILSLTGFFILSFLVGYLSFIAPLGLGVREGIITAGLAKYVSLSQAALGAVSTRIIQIVAELLFLILCLVWVRIPTSKLKRIEAFVLAHTHALLLVFSVCAYSAYFTLASFLRYINFYTGRFDLGNMDQTVWNTVHGRIFQLTNPDGINIMSRLAFHADFMLILLAPLYWIWQDPRMLLLIQSIALGSGGIFIFLIARQVLQKKSIALAISLSYLLYPAIQYANLFDFHAVTLAVPLLLATWYFFLKKKYVLALFFLFFACTTKEEVWLIAGFLGLYIFFFKKKYFLGVLTAILSFGVFYYLFWHAIPTARGGDHFALVYYSDFGATPTSIFKTIFLSPIKTIDTFLGRGQLMYLAELFGPVAFLPIFALPYLFFAGPDLGISLLSQNTQLHSIYYHYGAIPAVFIFLSTIYGLAFLQKKFPKIVMQWGVYGILFAAVVCAYLFGPFPGAKDMSSAMFVQQLSYAPLIDTFLLSIPRRYSVAATNNVGSHLSHRQKIFTIPVGLKEADIVVFLLDDDFAQPSLSTQKQMATQLDKDPEYVKLFAYNAFVVYKKKSVPTYYRRPTQGILPLFKGN